MIIKSKPPKMASLSSLYSTNGNSYYPLHTSSNAVSGQQNRLKILLNPPPAGFGANLVPNKKCNYEIYPSGCFDENGSLCDNDGMCICRPGYLIQIANLYCLRPSFIGEACYTTEQCERKVNNSGCFNYREEYREENPSAFFGPSQSSWPMGECRCRIGHRFDERLNACVRSIIGSWCSNVWDCEMADEDLEHIESGGHRSNRTGGYTHQSHIHSLSSSSSSSITTSHSALASTSRNKIANLVCENNICNCSQFFYYNKTAEECQYVETYGHLCQTFATITNEINSANIINDKNSYYINPSKRSIRFRNRRVRQLVTKSLQQQQQQQSEQQQQHEQQHEQHEQLTSTTNPIYNENQLNLDNNNRRQYHHIDRSIRSLLRDKFVDDFDGSSSSSSLSSFECNYPTICSTNKTCICADGYEHQPTMIPQCQRIGAHYTHYFHSGSSIRSMKGPDGFPHDRSSYHEGSSNVANFFEYVLYFLVPGLIIIFIFKPCFRRIGAWRNHIHQYQSDSDFYLATTANGRPVIAEMSVLPPCSATGTGVVNAAVAAAGGVNTSEKPNILAGNTATTMPTVGDVYSNEFASFAAFAPHLVCHNAYLFDSTDPCYATPISSYGCHPPTIPPTVPNNQQQQAASMALVREKLQTIEESQSEDGSTQMNNFSNSNSMNNQSLIAESCVDCVTTATTTTNNNNIVDQQLKANGDQSNIQNQSGNIYQDYRKNDDDDNNNNNNNDSNKTNIIDIIVDKSNRCDSNIIDNNN
uniref:Protein PIEZO homolog n=1 Tax=Dermatophagoides pteronyssinus TaxID=6956 RepID=A0A6P6XSM9_DERPT